MAERLRVGVVGLGYFGSFHAKHYAVHPEVAFVGIADPSPARAEFIRTTYGDIHVADHRDLIGRVDAVSIAAPTALHHRVASEFIEAGIHVLVEKPLARTAAEARDLVTRARKAGVVLQVGHIERFNPAYRTLKAALSAPLLIELRRHAPWTGRVTDVDVVLDLMIHDIDLALDLARSEVTEIAASGVAMMGYGLDAVTARISFASGSTADINVSRVAAVAGRSIIVHEAKRALAADLTAKTLHVFDGPARERQALDVPPGDALGLEMQAFLDAVAGRSSAGVGGGDAASALAIAERIRAGAEA